jgi:hypothetical protein
MDSCVRSHWNDNMEHNHITKGISGVATLFDVFFNEGILYPPVDTILYHRHIKLFRIRRKYY